MACITVAAVGSSDSDMELSSKSLSGSEDESEILVLSVPSVEKLETELCDWRRCFCAL